MISILLVDDHEMMRMGMKAYLEKDTRWQILGDFGDSSSCINYLQDNSVDILIIDVDLGEENGFDLVKKIRAINPNQKIIMYSMHQESGFILTAKSLAVQGYISKGSQLDEFSKCLEIVSEGGIYLEKELLSHQSAINEVLPLLSKREISIFYEILSGKNNEEIGQLLNLSKHTIEVYGTAIYEKTFCKNRSELLAKFQ